MYPWLTKLAFILSDQKSFSLVLKAYFIRWSEQINILEKIPFSIQFEKSLSLQDVLFNVSLDCKVMYRLCLLFETNNPIYWLHLSNLKIMYYWTANRINVQLSVFSINLTDCLRTKNHNFCLVHKKKKYKMVISVIIKINLGVINLIQKRNGTSWNNNKTHGQKCKRIDLIFKKGYCNQIK